MNITQQELAKIKKDAVIDFTLSSDLKINVIDQKLKDLTSELKRILMRRNLNVQIIILKKFK